MQDDEVFKRIFIPGYGVCFFVFVNGTMDYPAFNEIVLDLSAVRSNQGTRFPARCWSFQKSVQSGSRMWKHTKQPKSIFLTEKRFYL